MRHRPVGDVMTRNVVVVEDDSRLRPDEQAPHGITGERLRRI